jgi:Dehydrogenases (flavoproteins)
MAHDVVVVGGGPSGATAACELAQKGYRVALIDRLGRTKPCGGAIPPRLIEDFSIPEEQLVAKITTARMVSPTGRKVDIPIENGFVGMVDRKDFDPFLRQRAVDAGAMLIEGTFRKIVRDADGNPRVIYRSNQGWSGA